MSAMDSSPNGNSVSQNWQVAIALGELLQIQLITDSVLLTYVL